MVQRQGERSWLLPTPQGATVVVGLFMFGLLILGGLYLTPHTPSPHAPPGVPLGVANHKLRFVAYDLARQHPINDPMFYEIAELKPDYVLLQGVDEDDAVEIAESLGMQKSFHPQLYQRSERLAGKRGTWGNLILSRETLYEGAPLGGKRGGFGGWAVSIVDGREFFVANLHLSPTDQGISEAAEFEKVWRDRNSPPMVTAVLPSEPAPPVGLGFETYSVGTSGEYFYLTSDWKVLATGIAPHAGSGLAPRWIDVTQASAATTQPADMGPAL